VDRLCAACLRRIPPWDHALAALTYEFPVNELVKRFKFSRNFACGAILGDELLRKVRRTADPPPDCIVPVPLHRSRQFIRGFNQADKLARQLGAGLGLPVHAHVLARTRRTAAQSGLSSSSRKRNLKGAFQAGRVPVPGHVALVDDVLTTGETLAECTRALKQSGICRVTVWIAAVTPATR
jgi:ComF family protein